MADLVRVRVGDSVPRTDFRTQYIDGELVGNDEIPVTVPIIFGIEGLSCGYDFGEAVTDEYRAPFAFSGTIKKVTVDVSGELIRDNEVEVAALMAQQ